MASRIGDGLLSAEADDLLVYVFERGGEAPLSFDNEALHEAIRNGFAELVTVGVPDPVVVLTPAGLARTTQPGGAYGR